MHGRTADVHALSVQALALRARGFESTHKEDVMRRATVCKTAGVIALAGSALAWAQISLEPGQYELTTEIQIPGSSQPMKSTAVDCLSPAEARDFQELMIRKSEEASCRVSNLKQTAADKITYDTECAGSGTTASSELTFGSDWYSAVVRMQMNGASSTSTVSAKRTSAMCTDAESN
jgi:Protein of unknown function (DUF3617)